jgi:hypothetical protein
MAGPSGITARRELPFPLLTDTPDAERDIKELAEALDQFAKFNQGIIAARPLAAASKEGDIYWATDDVSYGPTGTWWVLVAAAWKMFPLPTIVAAMIKAEAVETGAVKALAITEPKLGEESVGESKLKNLAVTAAKIATNTITAAKLAAEAVGTSAIAKESVTEPKMAKALLTGAWNVMTPGPKAEANAVLQTAGVRLEAAGTVVRMRGSVKAKEEIGIGNTVATFPAGFGPFSKVFLSTFRAATTGETPVATVLEVAGTTITAHSAIPVGTVIQFDGLTYNVT